MHSTKRTRSSTFRHNILAVGLAALVTTGSVCATDGTWANSLTGGFWSNPANWSGSVADGSGSTATFNLDLAVDNTVHLDSPRTLTNLIFGDTDTGTAAGWLLDSNGVGTNVLTLDGAAPTITVNALGTGKVAEISAIVGGTAGFTKLGTGTLVLSGANTYTGLTSIYGNTASTLILANPSGPAITGNVSIGKPGAGGSGGTLQLGANDQLSPASEVTFGHAFSSQGAFFKLNGFSTSIAGLKNGTDLGGFVQNGAATKSTLTLAGSGNYNFGPISGFHGTISNGAAGTLSIVKSGSGTQTFSGGNTYTGTTTINGGTLKAGIASVGGINGAFGNGSAVTLGDVAGAALDITGFATDIGSLAGGGSTGGRVTLGAATLTVGRNNTNTTYAGIISGTGGFTKIGTGTQTLTGSNAHTGATTLTAGTLSVSASDNLGDSAANVVFDGGTLQVTGTAMTTLGHTATFTTAKTVTLDISDVTHIFTLDKVLNQTTGGLNKVGAGTIILNQANTYTGLSSVYGGTSSTLILASPTGPAITGNVFIGKPFAGGGGGTLQLGADNQLAASSVVTFDHAFGGHHAYFKLNGFSTSVAGLQNGGADLGGEVLNGSATTDSTLTLAGSGTYTFGPTNGFHGTISDGAAGTLSIVKSGTGTQTFTGANAYTGATTVNAGTLLITGSLSGSITTVNTGGTLGGTGTVGVVNVFGGSIAPGVNAGTLTTGALSLDSNAFLNFQLATPGIVGGVNDLLTINGAFTLDGTLLVSELAGFADGIYRLANYSGALTDLGLDITAFAALHPGSFVDVSTVGQVDLVVIPEPATAFSLLSGAGLLLGLRRRRVA